MNRGKALAQRRELLHEWHKVRFMVNYNKNYKVKPIIIPNN